MEGQRDHIGFVHLLQMCVCGGKSFTQSAQGPVTLSLSEGGQTSVTDRPVNQWVKAGEETD